MKTARVWQLRHHLSALLLVTMVLTFALVSVVALVWRVPDIEAEALQDLRQEVADVSVRLELLLGARQSRLELIATLLRGKPAEAATALLDADVGSGRMFRAVYLVSPTGRVEAVGLSADMPAHGAELVGSDLSASALFQAVDAERPTAWSGRLLSALSGTLVVGVAHRDAAGRVLIGEVPIATLLHDLQALAGAGASALWVVDRSGEVVADTEGRQMGRLNLQNWPLLQAALRGQELPSAVEFEGRSLQAALAPAPTLDWYVVGTIPRGLHSAGVQRALRYALLSFAAALAVGLLAAPFWAHRLVRALQEIVQRAALTTTGQTLGRDWPRGPVAEFNSLAANLQAMAAALQEREHKLQALFNVAPVPMAVVDADEGHTLLDVNDVWTEEVGYTRAEAVGLNSLELGLWESPMRRDALLAGTQDGALSGEIEIVCKSGEVKLFKSFGRMLTFREQRLVVWGSINIGPLRRVEQELRSANHDLEARVAQRAEALAASNEELSATLVRLRAAQAELVRSEKMAALGGLVAGVAHELNTPLGNGVMAISAMDDATRRLRSALQSGLRRADLQHWLDSIEQGCDIAARNLGRAADLVRNFKQVAVDQASARRRSFELAEVVHEMVVSLRPTFARTPYRIETAVPAQGLRLDSYPGPLGQVLGNLLQNAVLHGFDGRARGTVRITAGRAEEGRIWLRVSDDGRGIAPEHIGRIFDPFMTTKMGQGGTGLGLHISYNAVVNLLGGTLTVSSVPGQGACFELRLPQTAPRTAAPPARTADEAAA